MYRFTILLFFSLLYVPIICANSAFAQLAPSSTSQSLAIDLEQDPVSTYPNTLVFLKQRAEFDKQKKSQRIAGKWHTNSSEVWPCDPTSSWPCINGSGGIQGIQDSAGIIYWLSDDNRSLSAFRMDSVLWSCNIYTQLQIKAGRTDDKERIWCLRLFGNSIIAKLGRSYVELDRHTGQISSGFE